MSTGLYNHYQEFSRSQWKALARTTDFPLTAADVEHLRGLSDPIDLQEADLVYRTLSGIIQIYVAGSGALHRSSDQFLHRNTSQTPFVIGVAGSVAVGKSSTSRLLQELLRRWPQTPKVELVTTDGFLYPNAEIEKRDLLSRKGFPESYDRRQLIAFLQAVKAGQPYVTTPVYDHITYDIVPNEKREVRSPDILIVEGLNVIQPPRPSKDNLQAISVSDFFDFSIYVDADAKHIEQWYVERFMRIRKTAFSQAESYFHRYATLSDTQAIKQARQVWHQINLPNLTDNILPTRGRATLIICKGADHKVQSLQIRKI